MSSRLSFLLLAAAAFVACQNSEPFHRFADASASGSGGTVEGSGGIVTGSGGAGGLTGSGGKVGSGGTVTGSGGTVTGSGGSNVGATCTPTKTAPAKNFQSDQLGTSAVCIKLEGTIAGWGCSNMTGRTVTVNGTLIATCGATLPAAISGAYYFDISAGGVTYATFYTYGY